MTKTIKQAWKAHYGFNRAMASRRDVPTPAIDGQRILAPYLDGRAPQGVDELARKPAGVIATANEFRKICGL